MLGAAESGCLSGAEDGNFRTGEAADLQRRHCGNLLGGYRRRLTGGQGLDIRRAYAAELGGGQDRYGQSFDLKRSQGDDFSSRNPRHLRIGQRGKIRRT